MITVEVTGEKAVHLMDGDILHVAPNDLWGSVRVNAPFVIVTPATIEELQQLRAQAHARAEDAMPAREVFAQ